MGGVHDHFGHVPPPGARPHGGATELGDDDDVVALGDLVLDLGLGGLVGVVVDQGLILHAVHQTGSLSAAEAQLQARGLVGVGADEQHLLTALGADGQSVVLVLHHGDTGGGDFPLLLAVLVGTHGGQSLLQGVVGGVVVQNAALLLQGQDAGDGLVDTALGNLTGPHSGHDVGDDLVQVVHAAVPIQHAGHEQNVHTSLDGLDAGLGLSVQIGQTCHVHGIGDENAVVTHVTAYDVGQELLGDRGGDVVAVLHGGVNLGIGDVGHHEHVGARIHSSLEGDQLHVLDLLIALVHNGQAGVGVGGGIAVAGEVFGSGDHVGGVDALNHGNSIVCDFVGVIAEGTQTDDGVIGVVVHIHHRGEVGVDAQGAELAADDGAGPLGVLGVTGGAHGHVAGQSAAGAQTVHNAALLVNADEHGHRAVLALQVLRLQVLDQIEALLGGLDVVGEEDDAAKVVVVEHLGHLIVHLGEVRGGALSGGRPVPEVGHEHLLHLLFQGHVAQNLLHTGGGGVGPGGSQEGDAQSRCEGTGAQFAKKLSFVHRTVSPFNGVSQFGVDIIMQK